MFAAEPIDMIVSCPSGLVAQALGRFVMEYIESSGEFVGKHGTRLSVED